jgi:hypothetical protein
LHAKLHTHRYVAQLLTKAECAALIAAAEEHGFGQTPYSKEYRGNLRLIATDANLSAAVWRRMQGVVPATLPLSAYEQQREADGVASEWEAVGLNECWRLAKYHPGDQFQAHVDAIYHRNAHERSHFTVNIYMNGACCAAFTSHFVSVPASRIGGYERCGG